MAVHLGYAPRLPSPFDGQRRSQNETGGRGAELPRTGSRPASPKVAACIASPCLGRLLRGLFQRLGLGFVFASRGLFLLLASAMNSATERYFAACGQGGERVEYQIKRNMAIFHALSLLPEGFGNETIGLVLDQFGRHHKAAFVSFFEGDSELQKNKFQLKRETTYRQLIEAGLACFLEKGFAATRIEDIVERAGFTRGAFYFHFKTKEEVFFQILEQRARLRSGWIEVPRNYNKEETTLPQVLSKCLIELESRMKDDRKWFMVLIDFYWQTKEDPEACSKLSEHYQAWMVEIAEFVDVLKEGGWVANDKDSGQIAAQMWAFSEGYSATTYLFGEFNPKTLLTGFVKLLK